jgi:zinc transport system substrate-binding protein
MRKIVLKQIFIYILLGVSALVAEKLVVVSSIEPVASLIKSIAEDRVEVVTIVKVGASPHTYEPKISEMRKVERAKLYFAIGVEFEKSWLSRFESQNSSMKIVHLDQNIEKISAKVGKRERYDPHIWLSPKNMMSISEKILDALVSLDENGREFYERGFKKLILEIKNLDKEIKSILSKVQKGKKFMVFHPSWGYFAKEYGLVQIPIEFEGKEPKISWMIKLVKMAKREKIGVIVVQPEFSSKSVKILDRELDVEVLALSPLSLEWQDGLISLAKAIAERGIE